MPDLLKNVRSNLNEIKSGSNSSIYALSSEKRNHTIAANTNIDTMLSSTTNHRYIQNQMDGAKSENRGWYQNLFLSIIAYYSYDFII